MVRVAARSAAAAAARERRRGAIGRRAGAPRAAASAARVAASLTRRGAGGGRDRLGVPVSVWGIGRCAAGSSRVAGARRADAVVQAQQPEPGDLVGAVVEQPQAGHEVLDVRGFEESRPPYLTNGTRRAVSSISSRSLWCAGAHEHGLVAQPRPSSTCARTRRRPRGPRRARRGSGPAGAGSVPPVGMQPQLAARRPGGRPNRVGEVAAAAAGSGSCVPAARSSRPAGCWPGRQVGRVGAPEAVDGLRVVADHGQPGPVRAQQPDDVDLDLVDVLVLVDQHVIPAAGDRRAEGGIGQQRPPARAAGRRSRAAPRPRLRAT